jgi:Zn-dependent protease with chaperone function
MNFFEHQDQARRHTTLMVVLFLAAVAAIVAVLNVFGVVVFAWISDMEVRSPWHLFAATPRWVYWTATALTLGIIGFGTLKRLSELSTGGVAVARLVGARLVKRDSKDPLERRLLNVVEEMALASGITVPQVFVMDDQPSINAFAAGYSPNEAVVAVTRGTLENLTRDELQGVVGHEFSHILNGDMRLNIRLMGVIAGIVMIGALGGFLMDIGRGRSGDKDSGDIRLILVGLALWLIGSMGVFAGRLIKSAISRQREFLADASSVQFTRNPDGIGSALYKIGLRGSGISQRNAEELSHMCIGVPMQDFGQFEMLSTHPPIPERIERVMGPGASRLLSDRLKREAAKAGNASAAVPEAFASPPADAADAGALEAVAWAREPGAVLGITSQALVDTVGKPTTAHVEFARRILGEIPAPVRAAAGSENGARAVICALLLGEGDIRNAQLGMISKQAGDEIASRASEYAALLKAADSRIRVPLLDLALPTLKVLGASERDAILTLVKALVEADGKVTLREFVFLTLCTRHLKGDPKGPPPVKHKSFDTLFKESAVVLSLLAHAGRSGLPAFEKGMQALGMTGGVLLAQGELGMARVESALYELKLLAPMKKPIFIKACLAAVMADGKLTVAEGELMRALCAALDSPLPPILEDVEPTE